MNTATKTVLNIKRTSRYFRNYFRGNFKHSISCLKKKTAKMFDKHLSRESHAISTARNKGSKGVYNPASRGPFDLPRKVGKRKIEGTSARGVRSLMLSLKNSGGHHFFRIFQRRLRSSRFYFTFFAFHFYYYLFIVFLGNVLDNANLRALCPRFFLKKIVINLLSPLI